MAEKSIELKNINPVEILGVNNDKLKIIRSYFPKVKIIARGNEIKLVGEEDLLKKAAQKFQLIIDYFNKFNRLTDNNIDNLMTEDGADLLKTDPKDEIIVHGNSGIKVKARTPNQRKMVSAVEKNDMIFAVGPAGTGKTYTAVALAVRALKNKEVRRIILTRPAVEAGENLGFLPGDLKEKLDPYLQPLYDGLRDMIPPEKLPELITHGVIEIAPLAFMRGRTLDNAFVILDEAQNATVSQLKMFLTRMGRSAKFIITGDVTQIDLPARQKSGLKVAMDLLDNEEGIAIIRLTQKDVIRHQLVTKVIQKFESYDANI